MFNKVTTFMIGQNDIEILDGEMLKMAALKLPNGVNYDPDFFYMKVRAVSAGEYWGCNKNFDFFPEEELKNGYQTFLTAHAFKNHENKDIKNAIGDVLLAEWNDIMKGIDLLLRIDRKIAPTIVRGFEKGFMTDVSMGCRIAYSICSVCGNKAKTKYEYCEHIKYQRGKVLDDGRRIYEVNVSPKFHDISAVLNGAERAAKAIGLMIIGDKVAFENIEESFEKVANFEDSLSSKENEPSFTKVSNELDTVDLDMNMYEKMDKRAYVQKIAEIKKELQGKILEVAKGDYIRERQDNVEEMTGLLKTLYTDYWNRDKCYDIAKRIKYLAEKNGTPLEAAFHQFLKVLNFAGIELTPLELHDIYNAIIENETPDIRDAKLEGTCNPRTMMNDIDRITNDNSMSKYMNLPTMFKTMHEEFLPKQSKIIKIIKDGDGIGKTKAIIIKMKRSVPVVTDDRIQVDMMDNIVKQLMPERSSHRVFLMPRLIKMLKGDMKPRHENVNHFGPVRMLDGEINKIASTMPYVLSGLMYSVYQDDRVNSYNSGELADGVNKFAYEILNASDYYNMDKTAATKGRPKWGVGKALTIGIPLTYAYSALQRARIRNGERINSVNRYVAENPANASLLQVAFTPAVKRGLKKSELAQAGSIDDYLYKKFAYGSSEEQEKLALFDKFNESLYNNDIFRDDNIHNRMLKSYSKEQIGAIKQACVLTAMKKQDLANDILFKSALEENDLAEYLKIACDCIKMDFEKNAEAELAKEMGLGVVGDIIFNPRGTSTFASLPGNMIDAFVFSKLLRKTDKDRDEGIANETSKSVYPEQQFSQNKN